MSTGQREQYWLVKWGDEVRGPYDKTADPAHACKQAFGMASWNMLVKPLGARKSAFSGNKLYEHCKSPDGWRLLTEDELPDRLSRETRRSQKPRIVNGRVEIEDDRERARRAREEASAAAAPVPAAATPPEAPEPASAAPAAPPSGGLKPYVVAAINANALRLGKVFDEPPDDRALRQLAALVGHVAKPWTLVKQALADLPAEAARGVEVLLVLLEGEAEAARAALTAELRARIVRALAASWDYICADAFKDDSGREDPRRVLTRAEVAELAGDAGRLTEHGLSQDENELYYTLPEDERAAIEREAFPAERYGA